MDAVQPLKALVPALTLTRSFPFHTARPVLVLISRCSLAYELPKPPIAEALQTFNDTNMTVEGRISYLQDYYAKIVSGIAAARVALKEVHGVMMRDIQGSTYQTQSLKMIHEYTMLHWGKIYALYEPVHSVMNTYETRAKLASANFENVAKIVRSSYFVIGVCFVLFCFVFFLKKKDLMCLALQLRGLTVSTTPTTKTSLWTAADGDKYIQINATLQTKSGSLFNLHASKALFDSIAFLFVCLFVCLGL